jgi:hypothetical protein
VTLDEEMRALASAVPAGPGRPLQQVDVYERHCGDPGCQCQSTISLPDEDGQWVLASEVEELEAAVQAERRRADRLARYVLATLDALDSEHWAGATHNLRRFADDFVRELRKDIERNMTSTDEEDA